MILETKLFRNGKHDFPVRIIPRHCLKDYLPSLDQAGVMPLHSESVLCRDDTLGLRKLICDFTAYPYVVTVSSSGEPHLGVCIYGATEQALEDATFNYIRLLETEQHHKPHLFYFYNKDGRNVRFHKDGLTPRLLKRLFQETQSGYRFRDCVFSVEQARVLGAYYGPVLYLACCQFASSESEEEFVLALQNHPATERRECYIYQDVFQSEEVFLDLLLLQHERSVFPVKFTLDLLTIPATVCTALAGLQTKFLELRNNRLRCPQSFCDTLLLRTTPCGLGLQHTFSFGSRISGWCQLIPPLLAHPQCPLERLDIGFWIEDDDGGSDEFVEALLQNHRLRDISIKFWKIQDMDSLRRALTQNKALHKLSLQIKECSENDYLDLMQDTVQKNDSVEELDHGGQLQSLDSQNRWNSQILPQLRYNAYQKHVRKLQTVDYRDGLLANALEKARSADLISMTLKHHVDVVVESLQELR